MTSFQLIALIAFLGVVSVSYAAELRRLAASVLAGFKPAVAPAVDADDQTPADLVRDMVLVAELRDRLISLGCQDGAEACTVLLRVMVEFKPDRGDV